MTAIEFGLLGLLALIALILILCWLSLRAIAGEIGSLSYTVHEFIHDYKKLNDFTDRKRARIDPPVDDSDD